MPRLIEVEAEHVRAFDAIMECDERGEEVPEGLLQRFRDAALMLTEKREGVALFLGFLEEREQSARDAAVGHTNRARAIAKARERLEGYLLGVFEGKGVVQANGATLKFVVASVESVEVANPDALPDELCRMKREPDKTSIRRALEAGERIELAAGARIQVRKHLRVKPLAVKDRPGDTLLKGNES